MKKLLFVLMLVSTPAWAQIGPGPIVSDGTTINPTTVNANSICFNLANKDTGITRDAAGVLDFGTCTQGDKSGSLKFTNLTFTGVSNAADGTAAAPAYTFTNEPGTGMWRRAGGVLAFSAQGTEYLDINTTIIAASNGALVRFASGAPGGADTTICRNGVGIVAIGNAATCGSQGTLQASVLSATANGSFSAPAINVGSSPHGFWQSSGTSILGSADGTNNPVIGLDGSASNYQLDVPVLSIGGTIPTGNNGNVYLLSPSAGNLTIGNSSSVANANVKLGALSSGTNCNSSASPAVCGSAMAGSVALAAGGTTLVVNTTAVTANSQILLTDDSSLGTRLGVTCNTTIPTASVSARTAATSFTITVASAPAVNPACFSYLIVN